MTTKTNLQTNDLRRLLLSYGVVFLSLIVSCSSNNTKRNNNSDSRIMDTTTINSNIKILSDFDTVFNFKDKATIHLEIVTKPISGTNYNGVLDNIIEVSLSKDDSLIYTESLTKNSFGIQEQDFLKKATLYRVRLNSIDYENEKIVLRAGVVVPETDWAYPYEIEIDSLNKKHLFFIDEDGSRELIH